MSDARHIEDELNKHIRSPGISVRVTVQGDHYVVDVLSRRARVTRKRHCVGDDEGFVRACDRLLQAVAMTGVQTRQMHSRGGRPSNTGRKIGPRLPGER